jgi:hypothetical protein
MKLYDITNDIRELQAMADAGDLTAEEIKDTMDALELSQADKIEGCLMVRQDLLGDAAKFAEEAPACKLWQSIRLMPPSVWRTI